MASKDYHFRYLDESEEHLWADFVNQAPGGTIFQTPAYFHVVRETFKRAVRIASVFRGTRLVGGAVLYPKTIFGINYSTAPYFIPYNGIIVDGFRESDYYYKRISYQAKTCQVLLQNLRKNYSFCELHQSPEFLDFRHFSWNRWELSPDYTVVLDLANSSDPFDGIDRDQRRRIRNFEQLDISLHEMENLHLLYSLMSDSYSRHGMKPPLSSRELNAFSRALIISRLARCYAISVDGSIASAVLVIEDKPEVYTLFSGKSTGKDAASAELYLFWRVAQEYAAAGYHKMDLLGAMVPSIAKIKFELGGKLVRSDRAIFFRSRAIRLMYNFLKRHRQNARQV